MKLIGRLVSVIIVLGALLALCMPADAGAYLYAGKRKKVYCGIALIQNPADGKNNRAAIDTVVGSYGMQPDGSTYVTSLLTVLESQNSMKPAGWTLENPLAKTQNKFDPTYWVVPIASARNLTRLNMLYLPGSGALSLSDEERENLRRFVDGGGTLWVDNVGSASVLTFDSSSPLFINQLNFKSGGSGTDVARSRHHPLVCSPYWLTDIDIMNLGMGAAGGGSRCYCDMGSIDPAKASFDVLFPIIDGADSSGALAGTPSVVANTYGSGRVVATANAVGRGCLLRPPYSLPSLKFAFNIMSYASSWTDLRKDPRHSGASIDTLGANRLVEKWKLADTAAQPAKPDANKESAAMIYKNTVFYTAGNTLYALDQNGDTNGGVWPRDNNGAVVIWKWQNQGGKLSAPTIATVQNPAGSDCGPMEAVLVMDSAGTVFVLDAFPIGLNGVPYPNIQPIYSFDTEGGGSSSVEDSKWPCPPIYINGWIYAMSGKGRIFAHNPCMKKANLTFEWHYPTVAAYNSAPKCGPSFAFMKNATSGAVVGTVYWFTPKDASIDSPGDINDHMHAVPVSVSMDRVRGSRTGSNMLINVTYPGRLSAVTIRIFEHDGVTKIPVNDVTINHHDGQPQPDTITVTTAEQVPTNALIYASYSVGYDDNINPRTLEQQIEPWSPAPSGTGPGHPQTTISSTPCIGSDNMIYINGSRVPTGAVPSGGSILAYRQDSSTAILKWHYMLHSGLGDTESAYLPGLNVKIHGVVWTDAGSMMNPQPTSSPVVSGGKVFVTVSGTIAGEPKAALLCLKANPEFVVRITENGGYDGAGKPIKRPKSLRKKTDGGNYEVRIWQPNLLNAASGAVPLLEAQPAAGGVTVDYDQGTITFNDFSQNKLTSLGMQVNTFSPSLPVWVWLDNVEVPIDWTTWRSGALQTNSSTPASSDSVDLSGWNNLMWYYIVPNDVPCTGVHSSPVVIGNIVYFMTDEGCLIALNAETGEATCGKTNQDAIWTQETMPKDSGGTLDIKAGASVSGSNGVLMVPAPDGLHAFTNNSTLVADNSRIVEVDGGGEVTWAVDSISWPAIIPTNPSDAMAIKQGSVNKPARARYANTGEILFANSGTNQVCKIDRSGMVGFEGTSKTDGTNKEYVRWIYDKFVDPKHMLKPGQPTQLRAPTDAIMWQEMEPMQTTSAAGTSVVHCVIADSGNSRILDLVYRVRNGQFSKYDGDAIDPKARPEDNQYIDHDSGFVMPELNWVSKTDSLNERYAFDCLQLVTTPVGTSSLRQDIWVASSNFASNGTDIGVSPKGSAGLGGAILALGYRERSMTTGPADWTYNSTTSGAVTARCDHIALNGKVVPLANPRYFEVNDGFSGTTMMICDNYGVYEVAVNGSIPSTTGVLLEKNYAEMPRSFERDPKAPAKDPAPTAQPLNVPLQAASAQRLPNGRWLIANSYAGSDKTGASKFNGEVFEFDPVSGQIGWSSPRLQWVNPTNTTPATWKQITTNTYDLRQPKSACRQM